MKLYKQSITENASNWAKQKIYNNNQKRGKKQRKKNYETYACLKLFEIYGWPQGEIMQNHCNKHTQFKWSIEFQCIRNIWARFFCRCRVLVFIPFTLLIVLAQIAISLYLSNHKHAVFRLLLFRSHNIILWLLNLCWIEWLSGRVSTRTHHTPHTNNRKREKKRFSRIGMGMMSMACDKGNWN